MDKQYARELLDEAIAFEPGYYHFYRNFADYLLPQWYGKKGEIQAFAEETAAKLPEPGSSIVYFQIMSSLSCYCRQAMQDLPHASYPKLREGFASLARRYGTSNLTANRFAFMAVTFQDKLAAHEAFAAIVDREPSIWLVPEYFASSRAWADAP